MMMAAILDADASPHASHFFYMHETFSKTVSVITLVPRARVRRSHELRLEIRGETGIRQSFYIHCWTSPGACP